MKRIALLRTSLLAAMACTLAVAGAAHASPESQAARFADYGTPGVWLTKHEDGTTHEVLADASPDAARRPASSIKPLLALIALETGALAGGDEEVPWDGRAYPNFPHWEQASTLTEAMASSSESYFRTLATRIGRDTLAEWVARVDYGNGMLGAQAENAWHDGVLLITPRQQLAFADRLRRGDLPFAPQHMATVREAMRGGDVDGTAVYGKTGTGLRRGDHAGVGWYVGWTEGGATDAAFVLMVALEDSIDGRDRRVRLAHQLLRDTVQAPTR
ncbi:class D beta-lactamase [Alkalisalibacterium limincola]|uniref:Class D beta-lactamase n=1 Tax=Alkalisalibacterium limincola TaxID=2699169 RepID=A0A5C8KJF5_9GAMM|nr:class D beta-lactamase [Alkalisalibacterium limincola]TXK59629.1 class D beta-lactamase [Alkalisalibacterium limincola]